MAFSSIVLAVDDILVDWAAAQKAKLDACLTSIPGTALQDGTVSLAKLALKRSWSPPDSFYEPDEIVAKYATGDVMWLYTFPNIDGAVKPAINYHGGCVACPLRAAVAFTKQAGTQLVVRKNAVNQQVFDLNAAAFLQATPLVVLLGAAIAFQSGDIFDVIFTDGGGGAYTGIQFYPFWSIQLVSL